MKKYLAAVALTSIMASTPAIAQQQSDTVELNNIFESSKIDNIQALELSNQEMTETQGAWINYVAIGGVGGYFGGLSYANSVPASQRTWQGWTMAVGSGAAGGAIGGLPIGAARAAFLGGSTGFIGNSWATSRWGRR